MQIELQSRHRNRARRLFVPVSESSSAASPVVISRLFPRCAGAVALQVTSSRRTGTTLTRSQALARLRGVEVKTNSKHTAAAGPALPAIPACFVCEE
jgi:hypothetical protein